MKKEYTAPEAEIEKFTVRTDVFCTLSNGGNEGGNTGEEDDNF